MQLALEDTVCMVVTDQLYLSCTLNEMSLTYPQGVIYVSFHLVLGHCYPQTSSQLDMIPANQLLEHKCMLQNIQPLLQCNV